MFFTDKEKLEKLLIRKMPYGKYKGRLLFDLPVEYLEWFNRKGFPEDGIGKELAFVYEVKMNGLMHLIEPLRNKQ